MKNIKSIVVITLVVLGSFLWQSCAPTNVSRKRSDARYRTDINKYQTMAKNNPNDATGFLELGVISFELGKYPMAKKLLTRAYRLDNKNAKAMFYLGQLFEKQNQKKTALQIYKRYSMCSPLSSFRKQMSLRYEVLNREIIRTEMQQMLAQEQNLNITDIPPKSVAVFPFSYQGDDKTYSTLGIGIGEMMITDLSQVKGLTVIERIRLQAMVNEISLAQSGMVDETTAPRFGKLLGAAKIVHGNFDVSDKKNVKFNVGFWDVKQNYFPELTSQSDVMRNLFKMEKDMVFSLINNMGIVITAEERNKIQQIPTKNLQAFLSYCAGLEMENAGNFNQAAKLFQKAKQIDPDFKQAEEKIETSQTLVEASQMGEFDFALGSDFASTGAATTKTDLVNNRLNNISTSIGTIFVPGQDSRESAQEATHSGAEVLGDLPLPPAPPDRR